MISYVKWRNPTGSLTIRRAYFLCQTERSHGVPKSCINQLGTFIFDILNRIALEVKVMSVCPKILVFDNSKDVRFILFHMIERSLHIPTFHNLSWTQELWISISLPLTISSRTFISLRHCFGSKISSWVQI